jgi:hypothetical protein
MKKPPSAKKSAAADADMAPDHHFDYRKARPNRFAARLKPGSRMVVLDPDVAEAFTTPESVNTILRALLATMPKGRR